MIHWWRRLGDRLDAPWARFTRDVLIAALVVLGLVNQSDIRQEVTDREAVTYHGCQNSNQARHVLVSILHAAEAATPPDEQDKAKAFYDAQVAKIHYTDCSAYR